MLPDEQATQNTEQTNSETDQSTSADQTKSDTSTTQTDETEKVDLGTGESDEQSSDDETQEDTRTDEEKAADEERATLFGAPEGDKGYEITGLPDGIEVDKEALDALTPLAKQFNLSDKGMSALAGVYAEKILPHVSQQIVDGINKDVLAQRKEWEDEARKAIAGNTPMKTQGGEAINFGGRSLGEVQKLAAKTLDKYAPEGFRKWLDETGLGVHPQMIALAFNIGKDVVAEDREAEASDHAEASHSKGGRPMTDPTKFYKH